MTVLRWNEQTRTTLAAELPEAVVVVPIGATEQHGPHLATGTDALLAETVVHAAADRAGEAADRSLVVAPTIPVGASDHHLPYGGTLSLSPETLHAVLVDLARSVSTCGGQRLVIVNGHGGNHGVAHAAGAAASNRYPIAVATTDYWRLLPDTAAEGANVPGHAGTFETSLVLATRPALVADRTPRADLPVTHSVDGFDVHAAKVWSDINGFTDEPTVADAERGKRWLEALIDALSDRLVELTRVL